MRLRRPCEHGRYCEHYVGVIEWTDHPIWCPGGVFLAEDTLVVEKVDGEWPKSMIERIVAEFDADEIVGPFDTEPLARAVLDALASHAAETPWLGVVVYRVVHPSDVLAAESLPIRLDPGETP